MVSLLSLARGDVVLSLARPETRGIEPRGDIVCGAEGERDLGNVPEPGPEMLPRGEDTLPRGPLSHWRAY